jgi:hypothetical protein
MLQDAVWILVGVVGAALAMVSKKGFTWASTKLSTWWSATDARFKALESDVAAIKTKVGL